MYIIVSFALRPPSKILLPCALTDPATVSFVAGLEVPIPKLWSASVRCVISPPGSVNFDEPTPVAS